jgi:hypothetical protein
LPRPIRLDSTRVGHRVWGSLVAVAVGVLVVSGCGSTAGTATSPGTGGSFAPWTAASLVGRRVPSPTLAPGPGYTYSPSPLVLPSYAAAPTITPSQVPGPCWPLYGPGYSVPLNVTTATGSITVRWYHNGDPATLDYYVGAWARSGTLAERGDPTWTTYPPTSACGEVSATVSGLRSGVSYLVQLDRLALTPETIAGRTRQSLNQLGAVLVP